MNAIRVFAADSHAVVRAGLRAILGAQPGMEVVGEAADGPTAIRRVAELDPDVVVVEVTLAGMSGAEVTARLCEGRPDRKVLVLTGCEDQELLRLVMEAGAVGYVLKRSLAEELVRALQTVAVGGTYRDPTLAASADECVPPPSGCEAVGVELSAREMDVVRLIALGYSNKEVAARLVLSVKTVETYKARAMEKSGMRSRVDLVRYAARRGWLTEEKPPHTRPGRDRHSDDTQLRATRGTEE